MTEFSYNGVNFGYVKTSVISHDAVRDPSDTDLLHTKFTISISSVVAIAPNELIVKGGQGPLFSPGSQPGLSRASAFAIAGAERGGAQAKFGNISATRTPAELIREIRHMLLTPRKRLFLAHNRKTILEVKDMDDANGPKPQSVRVHNITDNLYMIDYVVEVCLRDCDVQDDRGFFGRAAGSLAKIKKSDWASFRYSNSQDIDEHGMSTVTMTGKLITRTSLLAKGGPDEMRSFVTPPPTPGFKRKSHYEVQADGLALNFHFTDTELYISPPPGAVEAKGTHTMSTAMGGKWMLDITLRLVARKEADKKQIMEMGVAICMDRLRRSGANKVPGSASQTLITKCWVEDDMYGPGVTVCLQGWTAGPTKSMSNNQKKAGGITGVLEKIVKSPLIGLAAGEIVRAVLDKAVPQDSSEPIKVLDTFNFGGDPLGSSKVGPIITTFGDRAYMPLLRLLSAAFNDPCLEEGKYYDGARERAGGTTQTVNADPTALSEAFRIGLQQLTRGVDYVQSLQKLGLVKSNGDESTVNIVSRAQSFNFEDTIYRLDNATNGGIWDTYLCQFTSHRDTGYRGFPAMKDKGGTAFVKLHDDTMQLRVTWIAKKIGAPPEVPSTVSGDTNLVLIDVVEGRDDVKEIADGQTVEYTMSGEYVYGIKDWEEYNNRWPIPPWLKLKQGNLKAVVYADVVSGKATDTTDADGQIVEVGA